MSHPETYYEAKAAVMATLRDVPYDDQLNALLVALGWEIPQRARDSHGHLIKVFRAPDVRDVLPPAFREAHPLREFSSLYSGVLVATSKADAADHTAPAGAYGSQRIAGIGELSPTDLRYPLAVAYPDKMVVTIEVNGRPRNERLLINLGSLVRR